MSLTGPSRTIIVQPIEEPAASPSVPERDPAIEPEPEPEPSVPERERETEREREPVKVP
jgi:hypothetical protein